MRHLIPNTVDSFPANHDLHAFIVLVAVDSRLLGVEFAELLFQKLHHVLSLEGLLFCNLEVLQLQSSTVQFLLAKYNGKRDQICVGVVQLLLDLGIHFWN